MDFLRAAAAIVFALAVMTVSAAAQAPADQQCLACHGMDGLQKPLADGQTLSLHISADEFAKSVHAPLGCTTCHADVKPGENHPPANNVIASRRAFSLQRVQVCQTCHAQQFGQWDKSVHAALAQDGSAIAPICTSCHNPHAVMKGAAATMDTVPCKTCHADIFTAYSGSVHGKLRGAGLAMAPLCFNCHGAHEIAVPTVGQGVKPACLGCHTGAVDQHRSWLPNTDLHLDVVSCVACHAPKAQRMVDLVLYNSATQKEIPDPVGVPAFDGSPAAKAKDGGLDPQTLLTVLSALNRPGMEGKTSLKGRLTVRTGVEAHELAPAAQAISDCKTCHSADAAAFQSVSISVAGPGGIPISYSANGNVLNSALSIQSVGGFYAIGGTRITVLDVLFVLALLSGIGIPVAHLMWKYTLKIYLAKHPQSRKQG